MISVNRHLKYIFHTTIMPALHFQKNTTNDSQLYLRPGIKFFSYEKYCTNVLQIICLKLNNINRQTRIFFVK